MAACSAPVWTDHVRQAEGRSFRLGRVMRGGVRSEGRRAGRIMTGEHAAACAWLGHVTTAEHAHGKRCPGHIMSVVCGQKSRYFQRWADSLSFSHLWEGYTLAPACRARLQHCHLTNRQKLGIIKGEEEREAHLSRYSGVRCFPL
jgi:hypothetical protein